MVGSKEPSTPAVRVFSPVEYAPTAAAIRARVPHSASTTSRSCGNAPRSLSPSTLLVLGPPNWSQFAAVSWTSNVVPSTRRERERGPMSIGPPPKLHGTRDNILCRLPLGLALVSV